MNFLIREKRKLVFDDKRFTPELLRQFASVIDSEKDQEPEAILLYAIDTTDASSFESTSSIIFQPGQL